jgi:Phosphotransferase enzyme family
MMFDTIRIEETICSIAKSLYKTTPEVEQYPPNDNCVWRLHFGDSKADRVIKLGVKRPQALLRERQILYCLEESGLEVPEIEFTEKDLPNTLSIPFIVMPKIADNNLETACLNDAEFALKACRKTGCFLGRLRNLPTHTIDPLLSNGLTSQTRDIERWQQVRTHFDDLGATTTQIEQILIEARKFIDRDYTDIAHRDLSPRQVVADDRSFAVIDWEFAAPGRVFRDLGDFIGGIRKFTGGKNKHARALIEGFCCFQPLSEAELYEISIWEIFSLLWAVVLHTRLNRHNTAQMFLKLTNEPPLSYGN